MDVRTVPLDKPHKRPITQMNSPPEAPAATLCERIAFEEETPLAPEQFAYQRARGTEMSLIGAFGLARWQTNGGGNEYIMRIWTVTMPSMPYRVTTKRAA